LIKDVTYDKNGNLKSWYEYTYDEAGNLRINEYDADGNMLLWEEYTYDAAGNVTKFVDYIIAS
jgi:hypothetical protein